MMTASETVSVVRFVFYGSQWLAELINHDIGRKGLSRSEVIRRRIEASYAKQRPEAE
jgi:hypothetical protein